MKSENAINAYSKFQFANFIRLNPSAGAQVVVLRYFSVHGPREAHKGRMASIFQHFNNQIKQQNEIVLFKLINGVSNEKQKRDLVYIDDCIKTNLWAAFENERSGIFNVGTGGSRSFNQLAEILLRYQGLGKEHIKYIDFLNELFGSHQNYTKASLTNLKYAGFNIDYKSQEIGIPLYLNQIHNVG